MMLTNLFTLIFCLFSPFALASCTNDKVEAVNQGEMQEAFVFSPINWAQPPVGCVEELVPGKPKRGCLDLSRVNDPQKDLPGMSPGDEEYWQLHKRELLYCRSVEILKREAARPGSFSSGAIEVAWMQANAVKNRAVKIAALEEASHVNQMPAQVLTGAIFQESLFSELGIAEDGGNYSCGLGQINIVEWCRWAIKQPPSNRRKSGLGKRTPDCTQIDPAIVKPFYDIAKTRLNGLPEYRLNKDHFADISFDEVVHGFPSAPDSVQAMRYSAVRSFISSCQDPGNGIAAKANELASLYEQFIPTGLKLKDQYAAGEKFERTCHGGYDRSYPLQAGWLLAVGSYNAGPKAVDALAYYNKWNRDALEKLSTFKNFNPVNMVHDLYWSGKYNAATDKIDVTNLNGSIQNWNWFKTCVLQRHIARVVQHVTLPGTDKFIDSLEGKFPCAKSVFDANGKLVKSGVPTFRQVSSGVNDARR